MRINFPTLYNLSHTHEWCKNKRTELELWILKIVSLALLELWISTSAAIFYEKTN